jgi:hypothetical protein
MLTNSQPEFNLARSLSRCSLVQGQVKIWNGSWQCATTVFDIA